MQATHCYAIINHTKITFLEQEKVKLQQLKKVNINAKTRLTLVVANR